MGMPLPKRLCEQLRQSTIEFFQGNGVQSVVEQKDCQDDFQWTAVIGMAGDQITGSLAVTCKQDLLDKTHPNHGLGMPVGPEDLVDWLGEISNQILGRLKNFTLDYGMAFSLSAPNVVKGRVLEVQEQGKKSLHKVFFAVDGLPLVLTLIATLKSDFNYDKAEQVRKSSKATEGDAFLF